MGHRRSIWTLKKLLVLIASCAIAFSTSKYFIAKQEYYEKKIKYHKSHINNYKIDYNYFHPRFRDLGGRPVDARAGRRDLWHRMMAKKYEDYSKNLLLPLPIETPEPDWQLFRN